MSDKVLSNRSPSYKKIATQHLKARRYFLSMQLSYEKPKFLPASEIIPPESSDALLSYSKRAEKLTGIEW